MEIEHSAQHTIRETYMYMVLESIEFFDSSSSKRQKMAGIVLNLNAAYRIRKAVKLPATSIFAI